MSQSLSDQLCINEIAKLWKGESDTPLSADDIASVLLDAVLNEEFQFRPEGAIRGEDGTLPRNFDVRLRLLIETSRRNGNPVRASDWRKHIEPPSLARWTPGGPSSPGGSAHADTEAKRQALKREIFISMPGLSRWCNQPAFEKWASRRKLGRPTFMADDRNQTTKDAKGKRGKAATLSKRGRPPRYPWDEFWREVTRIADLDGLPEIQADLEEVMAQWCENNWNEQPGTSTIREKIAPPLSAGQTRPVIPA